MDCHQLISYSTAQFILIYPLLNHNLNFLPPIQQLNQKPRIVYQPQNKNQQRENLGSERISYCPKWPPHSYSILNDTSNLIIRNHHHLIPTNEKFIVKHNHDNIIEPSETTSQKTIVQILTCPDILPHHQLEQNLNVLLRNQKGIWRNVE